MLPKGLELRHGSNSDMLADKEHGFKWYKMKKDMAIIETHKVSKFMVYDRMARNGSSAYSPKSHSAPHFEGHYVEGMEEWASHYCFNKKEDGSYEAELDEAWDEGSHYGGGTINVAIPKEWLDLTYDEFLERVITLLQQNIMDLPLMT